MIVTRRTSLFRKEVKLNVFKPTTSSTMDVPKKCQFTGCKKKLNLASVSCKCSLHFCPTHRLPETHACTYDFVKDHKDFLLKTLSTPIIASKVEAI